jgi:hypothetical protein
VGSFWRAVSFLCATSFSWMSHLVFLLSVPQTMQGLLKLRTVYNLIESLADGVPR